MRTGPLWVLSSETPPLGFSRVRVGAKLEREPGKAQLSVRSAVLLRSAARHYSSKENE